MMHSLTTMMYGIAFVVSSIVPCFAADISTATDNKVYFNTVVQIQTDATKRNIWTHPASRTTPISGVWDDVTKDHHEILLGGDDRQNNGGQFLMFQSAKDHGSVAAVNYGDDVEVCSLCTRDSLGWGGSIHNGVFPRGERRWFANNSSRFTDKYGEIFVARSTNPRTADGSQVFTFVKDGDEGNKGPVMQGDKIRIISKAPYALCNKAAGTNNRVWVNEDSRYGSGWHELLIGESDSMKAANGGKDRSVTKGVFSITQVKRGDDKINLAIDRVATYELVNGAVSFPKLVAAFSLWHKFLVPALGTMSFDVEGVDLQINLADAPFGLCQYHIILGGWGNNRSVVREGWFGKEIYAAEGAKLPQPKATIGLSIDKKTKKITITGLTKPFEFVDPNFKEATQYCSLSSLDTPVKISNFDIGIDDNVPAGFEEEESAVTEDIACGSRNGELEVWGVSADRTGLQRYNQYTLADDPWERVDAKDAAGNPLALDAVSISSDGVMVVLDARGKGHMYDWTKKIFVPMAVGAGNESLDFDVIAVGNAANIWAVDVEAKSLYQHTDLGWVLREKGVAVDVAVGVDGTVVALNDAGKPYMMVGAGKWDKIGDLVLSAVSVGSKEHIWGVNKDNQLVEYTNDAWAPVLGADGKPAQYYKDVAVNAAGTVFVLSTDDDVYHKGENGFAVSKAVTPALLTLAPGQLISKIQLAADGQTFEHEAEPKVDILKASGDSEKSHAPVKKAGKKAAKKAAAKNAALKADKKVEGKVATPTKPTRAQKKKDGAAKKPGAKEPTKAEKKSDKKAKKEKKHKEAAVAKKGAVKKAGKPVPQKRTKKGQQAKPAKKLSGKNPEVKMPSKKAAKSAGKKAAGKK